MSKATQSILVTSSVLSLVGSLATFAVAFLFVKRAEETIRDVTERFEDVERLANAYVKTTRRFISDLQEI